MFYELQASCYVHIAPQNFSKSNNLTEEVMNSLQIQHANKIIRPKRGLCITVSEIDKIGDARIVKMDGGCYVKVVYKLLLLKPYKNEVIECVVFESDPSGIQCTFGLGFFHQLFVPLAYLPQPITKYESAKKQFVYESNSGSKLPIIAGDTVRLKVIDVEFRKKQIQNSMTTAATTTAAVTAASSAVDLTNSNNNNNNANKSNSNMMMNLGANMLLNNINANMNNIGVNQDLIAQQLKKQPMVIIASMNGPGLGPNDWWD